VSDTPTIAAVLPAKRFERAKTRLAPALDAGARAELARRLFERVLRAALEVFDAVWVVTDGEDVAALAQSAGARVVPDPTGHTEQLAAVVDAGLRAAEAAGATTGVVLMADLAGVDAEDLRQLRVHAERVPVVVAPDHAGRHTNALALTPPTRFPTAFGDPESLARHLDAAGPGACVLQREGLARDVDRPEDLEPIAARGAWARRGRG
jgi:2-phospho-L-lactate guanylyltransferase